MNLTQAKIQAAEAALSYIQHGDIIGVGTGSTADIFIDLLAKNKGKIEGAVASSQATAARLRSHNIEVLDLNHVGAIPIYIDGADEATSHCHLTKGGGGALTREKIVAQASEKFICIADKSKHVDRLGRFPIPLEVIPMARSLVGRHLVQLGGQPELRTGFTTDNGNLIVDIHHLDILNPIELEREINQIPGIVSCGIFAIRGADVLILGSETEVNVIHK